MKVLLGEIITWDIPAGEVPYADMRTAFENANLGDPDHWLKPLRVQSAFGRATKALKRDRLVEKVKSDRGNTTYQLTQRAITGDRINHLYEASLGLDGKSGVVTSPDDPNLAMETSKRVQAELDQRNSADINRLLQKLFRDRADLFPINPKKGTAYFVPDEHREFTEAVQQFVRDMGGSMTRWPVPVGTQQGNESVAAAVTLGIDSMIGELEAAINDWDDTTRKDTVERANERWDVLQFKLAAYSDFLSESKDSLEKKMEAAKERLKNKLFAFEKPESEKQPATV